ncbi:HrpA [Desulfamplus magnetovallimortis]|uniref:HrpA n=1 Tax=Desulfamplus magnetovallimortis TaxID=1246637 RepID=A0A1W1H696_9BACT|nr:ATP-dependent RNA helicase HrpA [Desulfamplus magnetovallimortis]SLM28010.1 HrpA [Desulfamplus magnetovallimortis]
MKVSKRVVRQKAMPKISFIKELPITDKKDEIIDALKKHRVVIVSGETGSGKTTQIPKFCIAAGRGVKGTIGCTQPRRIAAINVASRIAEELEEPLGKSVGYKIRFDDKTASDSIIKVMTDGILLAETQRDALLREYDTIIVDEAHERSLNIDFTLGILRNLVRKRRDLTLVITSATIDTEKFSRAFDDAPIIEVSGRMYPVEVRYMPVQGSDDPEQDDQGYVEAAADAVEMIQKESRYGDILIFMPTEQDITETIEILRGRRYVGVTVLPLYARLSAGEQGRIFHRGPGRKIIVSTNVAETSLTIPGIKYVVDTGFARIPHYSPRTRTTALPVTPISRSSADQRKGRCGRVANGICIRLFDEDDYASRPLFTSPEILRSNLAEVILRMISLKLGDVASFPFIDAPSSKSVKDGFETLFELGAIKVEKRASAEKKRSSREYVLTDNGRIMAGIPVDPKLSRILIEADERGCLEEAAVIASALSISDPRQRPQDKTQQADQKHALFKDPASDFISLVNIWKAYHSAQKRLKSRSQVRKFCQEHFLSFKRLREWNDIHGQILSVLREHGVKGERRINIESGTKGLKSKEFEIGGQFYTELHKSLLCGYLGNIAHKKDKNIYHAAKGQKAMIFPGSGIFGKAGNWIVAAEYVETSQLFARTAATIDPGWLEELGRELCTFTWSSPRWEKKRGEVVASEQVSLFGLVIVPERTVSYGRVNPAEAGEIFIRKALVEGEVARPFPFMLHNQKLIAELQDIEDKTRKRDILVTDDDIYLFYRKNIDRDFFNIRTFAKYIKNRAIKEKDKNFLFMTLDDLQQKSMDDIDLEGFPDKIEMGTLAFHLEYGFEPGAEKDGVTVKIPAVAAASADPQALEWGIPGLFREKITALIKSLPKSHRVKLLPASEKADIIAKELSYNGRPLFNELSFFVRKRFGAQIPPSAWSEKSVEDHLKMRISIRDENDHEIAASRNRSVLNDFSNVTFSGEDAFEEARKRYEKENIRDWSLGEIKDSVTFKESGDVVALSDDAGASGFAADFSASGADFANAAADFSASNVDFANVSGDSGNRTAASEKRLTLFPAFTVENGVVSLRLFKNRNSAVESHMEGVRVLFTICYEKDFNALKKDIKGASRLKRYASFFGGAENLNNAMFRSVTRQLFSVDIRDRNSFEKHAGKALPELYSTGQILISWVTNLCESYEETASVLRNINLKSRKRPQLYALSEQLQKDLESLMPADFLDIYTHERIELLERYIAAIRIRVQRADVDMTRDQKKAAALSDYSDKLSAMLNELDNDSSREKADAVEKFFWMLEEYKISLFAQEIKTSIKISPARLDALYREIHLMI